MRLAAATALCLLAVIAAAGPAAAAHDSAAPGSADVGIAGINVPSTASIGDQFDLIVVFYNAGPDTATNETVMTALPSELAYQSGNAGCSAAGQVVMCRDPSPMSPNFGSAWALHVTVVSGGTGVIYSHVFSDQADPGPGNNDASATISVSAPACSPGSWSSTGEQPCTLASPGFYVSSTGATSQTPAPAGSYTTGPGATSATPCAPGTYSSSAGQAACTPAPAGEYVSGTGATSATLCAPGTYSSSPGRSTCTPAPPGTYVSLPGATTPILCGPGTYQRLSGQTSCTPAPAGSYATGPGATSATPCAPGTYSSSAGQAACTPAPAGGYVSGTGATFPTLCAAGTYQPAAGATGCITADPNHYVPTPGASSETPCPSGTYQPLSGQTSCIADDTPPVFAQHANVNGVEATGPSGAAVTYAVVAHDPDNADSAITVTCAPASGATFPIGTTTVTCNAHDPIGNTAAPMSFTVTVVDTTPPTMPAVSSDISDVTHTPGGSVTETFGPYTATDLVDGSVPVTCTPSSGSSFPVGVTTVDCSATDAHGNTAYASFTVTITYVDITPPTIAQHANLTVNATGPAGAPVAYTVTATDPDDPGSALTVVCAPASGATFQIGTTTVTCNAHDPAGNDAAAMTFTVTVVGAADQLQQLLALVTGLGPGKSLPAKVRTTIADLASGNVAAAQADLTDFISEVKAQSGKSLTAAQAAQLIAAAQQIKNTLG